MHPCATPNTKHQFDPIWLIFLHDLTWSLVPSRTSWHEWMERSRFHQSHLFLQVGRRVDFMLAEIGCLVGNKKRYLGCLIRKHKIQGHQKVIGSVFFSKCTFQMRGKGSRETPLCHQALRDVVIPTFEAWQPWMWHHGHRDLPLIPHRNCPLATSSQHVIWSRKGVVPGSWDSSVSMRVISVLSDFHGHVQICGGIQLLILVTQAACNNWCRQSTRWGCTFLKARTTVW